MEIKDVLENHFREMQDIEFTIEKGTLYMLQTRTGKRAGGASVKIACDMVKEKLIDEKKAVLRIPAGDLSQILLPSLDPDALEAARKSGKLLTKGVNASPGGVVLQGLCRDAGAPHCVPGAGG